MNRLCSVEGCTRVRDARGMCNRHYLRWRKHGDPNVILTNQGKTTDERFWGYVDKQPNGCWLWTSAVSPRYGVFWVGGAKRSAYAHRYAYELLVGPIPEGAQIDHRCENRLCVNPEHLEPVTPQTNTVRFWRSRGHTRDRDTAGRFK